MTSGRLRHAALLCVSLGLVGPAFASPAILKSLAGSGGIAPTPVVVFGKNSRETIAQFATAEGLDPAAVRRRHAASGLVQCGDAHGAGQLTLANNVITTAAHVFFNEEGTMRAASCMFVLMSPQGREIHVPIDLSSIVAGSRNPYAVATVHDWTVAKLAKPVDGAVPYAITPHVGLGSVEFVARGHVDWGDAWHLSLEKCHLYKQLAQGTEGTREFSFNCETGNGASGGAVLTGEIGGELAAVLVGYRSVDPDAALPFSSRHYNFAVSVEGAFRDATEKAAAPATPPAVVAATPAPAPKAVSVAPAAALTVIGRAAGQ